jgi:hypothetical protein
MTTTSTSLKQFHLEETVSVGNTVRSSLRTTKSFQLDITELPLETLVRAAIQVSVLATLTRTLSTGKVITTSVGQHMQKQTHFSVARGKKWLEQPSISQAHLALDAIS